MIFEGLSQAFQLLFSIDTEILNVMLMTLQVSGTATIGSVLIGIPFGLWLALEEFRGKQALSGLVNVGMGLPPVVVGLCVLASLAVVAFRERGDKTRLPAAA